MTTMKILRNSMIAVAALLMGLAVASCSDANEYEDAYTNNPTYGETHPESLSGTTWVRGKGLKLNAYGQDVQGFVESIEFISESECVVKMSKMETTAATDTWLYTDESNNDETPTYEYTYSSSTGDISIIKNVKNDKGAISKVTIFSAVAIGGETQDIITVVHYGDTPVQTYLVKQAQTQVTSEE